MLSILGGSAILGQMNTLRIQDMPSADRPREKLARLGPQALDHAELLALFIETGTRGQSAIEIARALLNKFGSLGALGSLPMSQLTKEHGLGPAKASKLTAAFELGVRVSREVVEAIALDSPENIYRCYAPQVQHLPYEQVMVAVVNVRLRHIATSLVSLGTPSESSAHPRDILRPVITRAASGFILIHNHPSGDPRPSRADETVTRRVKEAADLMQVNFIDHVIIGQPGSGREPYFSFRSAGIVG